jgi:hypothetical protein
MKKVNVRACELLIELNRNLAIHEKDYAELEMAYRVELLAKLSSMLEDAEAGKDVDAYHGIQKPTSHVNSYETAIRMVEMCVDETIELDQREFGQYIMDEWDWKGDFLRSQALYKK